jgi:hypothetical protein
MIQPVSIHRSRKHLWVAIVLCITAPLCFVVSVFATDESIPTRLFMFGFGVLLVILASVLLREMFGKRPIIRLDSQGIHYRETPVSFDVYWHEIAGVSRQEYAGSDTVILQLTSDDYEKFCSRLPKRLQSVFRLHGRSPGTSRWIEVIGGVSMLPLNPTAVFDLIPRGMERTLPRYGVRLRVVNLQISAEDLEAMLLRFRNAR